MACASSQRKQPSFSSTKERLLTISQFLAHETQGGGKAMDRSHADKRSRRELLDEIEALKAEVATLRARPGSMTGGMTGGMTEYAPDGDYTATGQIVDIASVLGVLRSRGDLPPVRDPRLDVNARRQFEFSRSIMGAMVEGVVVLDHQGLLRQINPAAQAMLGFKFGELLGRNFHDFCHAHHPDGTAFPLSECPIQRATQTGETIRGAEDFFLRADKTFLPVQYSCSPVITDGEVTDMVLTFQDITERNRLQQELRDSERRFRGTFELAAVGIGHIGIEGNWQLVNPSLATILGYASTAELVGQPFMALMHADDSRKVRALTEELLAGQRDAYQQEVRFQRGDGTLIWTSNTVSLVSDPSGAPAYFISVVEDISEYRRLTAAVQESERVAVARAKQFDAIFEAIADGVILYDRQGNIVRSNAAARQMFGLDPASDAFTRPLRERLERFNACDAQGNPFRTSELPIMEPAENGSWRGMPMDVSAQALDGRHLWLSVSGAPFYDSEGRPSGAVCILRDITRRHQLEQQIIEESNQRETILEALGDAILVYDAKGNIVRLNEAAHQMLGLASVDDYFSLPPGDRTKLLMLRHEDGTPFTREEWPHLRLLRGETLTSANTSYVIGRNFKGQDLISSYSGRPIRDEEGHITGAVLSFHEVTKQYHREQQHQALISLLMQMVAASVDEGKHASEEHSTHASTTLLVRSSAAMNEQLASATHIIAELRRVTQHPAEHTTPRDQVAALIQLRRLDGHITHLNRTLALLREVAHLASGTLELTLAPCDLTMLVQELIASEQRSHPFHTIMLDRGALGQPALALVDEARIRQALHYYFTHVFAHTPPDAPITVHLRHDAEQQQAYIAIESRWAHQDEATLARQFEALKTQDEPFTAHEDSYGHAATAGNLEDAFGFGLAISKALAEQQRGSAGFTLQPEQERVTLWLTLPLLTD